MSDDHGHGHDDLLDTNADVLALYRAVLDGDDEGRETIRRGGQPNRPTAREADRPGRMNHPHDRKDNP